MESRIIPKNNRSNFDVSIQKNEYHRSSKRKLPTLPPEMLNMVFQYLNEKDLINVSLTCRYWKSVFDGIQIHRMNSLVYVLYQKNCRYFNRCIGRPIKNLPHPQNLMLMRETLIRGLVTLRSRNLKIKFDNSLNVNRDKIVFNVLKTSELLLELFLLFKRSCKKRELITIPFCPVFYRLLKKRETHNILYVMNLFPNLCEDQVCGIYESIFQQESLESSLQLLSQIKNKKIHEKMFKFILLPLTLSLEPKTLLSLIQNNFDNKQSHYDFLTKLCNSLVQKGRSFSANKIIEFLPKKSKRRAYCLAGMSRGLLQRGKISKSVEIAKLIRGLKFRSNFLNENVKLLIIKIDDELKSIRENPSLLQRFQSRFEDGFSDLLLGLTLTIDAIPIESIKIAVEKDAIQRCKKELGFIFCIESKRVCLNLASKAPIIFKSIEEQVLIEVYEEAMEKHKLTKGIIQRHHALS